MDTAYKGVEGDSNVVKVRSDRLGIHRRINGDSHGEPYETLRLVNRDMRTFDGPSRLDAEMRDSVDAALLNRLDTLIDAVRALVESNTALVASMERARQDPERLDRMSTRDRALSEGLDPAAPTYAARSTTTDFDRYQPQAPREDARPEPDHAVRSAPLKAVQSDARRSSRYEQTRAPRRDERYTQTSAPQRESEAPRHEPNEPDFTFNQRPTQFVPFDEFDEQSKKKSRGYGNYLYDSLVGIITLAIVLTGGWWLLSGQIN